MRTSVILIAGVALCATSQAAIAKGFHINNTTWTYVDKDGTSVEETVDAKGAFIANSTAGKHLDHGTAVMKGGKACFTSAMTKEGEVCWTAPADELAVGSSFDTTSDKGEKLKVTRAAYKALSMPH